MNPKIQRTTIFQKINFQSYPFFSREDQVVRSQAKWKLHFRVFHILCVISPAPHTNIPPTWHFAQIWKQFQVVSQPKVVNFLWIIFRTPPVYWKFDMLPGSSRSSPYFLSSYQYHPPLRPILEPRFTQGHSATITPPGQDRSQSQIMLSFSFAIFTILPPTPKGFLFACSALITPPGRTEIGDDNVCHWLKVVWGSVSTKLLCCHTLIILLNVSLLLFMFSRGVQTICPYLSS